jgi:hypothetical protein
MSFIFVFHLSYSYPCPQTVKETKSSEQEEVENANLQADNADVILLWKLFANFTTEHLMGMKCKEQE